MLRNWLSVAIAITTCCGGIEHAASAGTPADAASGARRKAHPVSPPSLCLPTEKDYFSCPVSRGRTVSVCGAHDEVSGALVQYRIGVVGMPPEFVYPAQPGLAAGAFEFIDSGSAKSSLLNLRFKSGRTTYVVYRFSAAMSEQIDAGVASISGAGALKYTPCHASLEQARFYDMSELKVNRVDVSFDELVFPPH